MIFDHVTAKQIDAAISLQCSFKFDRERFSDEILKNSPEFVEYIFMLCEQYRRTGQSMEVVFAAAMSLGVEIGVALAMQERHG
jgi:hypothetical protein